MKISNYRKIIYIFLGFLSIKTVFCMELAINPDNDGFYYKDKSGISLDRSVEEKGIIGDTDHSIFNTEWFAALKAASNTIKSLEKEFQAHEIYLKDDYKIVKIQLSSSLLNAIKLSDNKININEFIHDPKFIKVLDSINFLYLIKEINIDIYRYITPKIFAHMACIENEFSTYTNKKTQKENEFNFLFSSVKDEKENKYIVYQFNYNLFFKNLLEKDYFKNISIDNLIFHFQENLKEIDPFLLFKLNAVKDILLKDEDNHNTNYIKKQINTSTFFDKANNYAKRYYQKISSDEDLTSKEFIDYFFSKVDEKKKKAEKIKIEKKELEQKELEQEKLNELKERASAIRKVIYDNLDDSEGKKNFISNFIEQLKNNDDNVILKNKLSEYDTNQTQRIQELFPDEIKSEGIDIAERLVFTISKKELVSAFDPKYELKLEKLFFNLLKGLDSPIKTYDRISLSGQLYDEINTLISKQNLPNVNEEANKKAEAKAAEDKKRAKEEAQKEQNAKVKAEARAASINKLVNFFDNFDKKNKQSTLDQLKNYAADLKAKELERQQEINAQKIWKKKIHKLLLGAGAALGTAGIVYALMKKYPKGLKA